MDSKMIDTEYSDMSESGLTTRMPPIQPTRRPSEAVSITNTPVTITDKNRFPRTSNGGRKKSKKSRKSRKSRKSMKSRKTRRRRRRM